MEQKIQRTIKITIGEIKNVADLIRIIFSWDKDIL